MSNNHSNHFYNEIIEEPDNQSHFGSLCVDSASDATSSKDTKDPLIPNERFIYTFRPEWEDIFRDIDDKLIKLAQHYHLRNPNSNSKANKIWGRAMQMFSWLTTFITRIENLSSICLFVLALGYDHIGRYLTIVGIISGLAAQVPKRFLFRKRPYMVGRALPSGKLDTSSFPSRAVTCSVVYAFAAIVCYNYQTGVEHHHPENTLGFISSTLLVFLAFLASSFARIHLGAHFPSDCLGGLILGLFISITSWCLFQLPNIFGCPSCENDLCYVNQIMDNTNFQLQNIGVSIAVMGITGIFLVLSSCPPLVFWNKSAPIFGTICACVVAELLMVCPGAGAKGLKTPDRSNYTFVSLLLATSVAGFQLIVAFFASKAHKKTRNLPLLISTLSNLLIYLFFSFGLLFVLVKVRLAVIGQHH